MAVNAVHLVVYGLPAPQGSKSFKGISEKTGHAILVESSKGVKPWREDVETAALRLIARMSPAERRSLPLDGPLIGRVVVTMPKPKNAPKTRTTYPDRYPDLSKLLRSTEDAMTTAGLWKDDARVITYERLSKVYPGEDPEALARPGAVITVRRLTASDAPGVGLTSTPAVEVDHAAVAVEAFRAALEHIREADPSGQAGRIAANALLGYATREAARG
ncbi:RusA family crossover junction endodeoxyribonuclease [Micromonospora sp. NPDC006766]|uniref:RusA family crossover junction endodeoxyribonuclease n=1 Tax=Micromonospora sp. NPDC006766 TaxID=3154778 RepID=UPI00340BA7BD